MARELKDRGHEAIAIGVAPDWRPQGNPWGGFSEETIATFAYWADIIIDFSDTGTERLKPYQEKVHRFDIGIDRWHNAFHPELREIMQKIIAAGEFEE